MAQNPKKSRAQVNSTTVRKVLFETQKRDKKYKTLNSMSYAHAEILLNE